MKVTLLEELRVFGVVAVAPLVEHVDAWTLGPLPSKQTVVPYSSDVYCSRFEEPRVRRALRSLHGRPDRSGSLRSTDLQSLSLSLSLVPTSPMMRRMHSIMATPARRARVRH